MKYISILLLALYQISGCGSDIIKEAKPQAVKSIDLSLKKQPVLAGKPENGLLTIGIYADGGTDTPMTVTMIRIRFAETSAPENLASMEVYYNGVALGPIRHDLFGKTDSPSFVNEIHGSTSLSYGNNSFVVSFRAQNKIDKTGTLLISGVEVFFSDKSVWEAKIPADIEPLRFGVLLRAAGQDGCNTYRIPGLVTTNKGTLIAVYDNRYLSSVDLQGDIDIGMSRSTDGGQTWEPMKVIMDMGEWGGKPQSENGVGDPCVLVDSNTGTIWVAALWINGFPGKATWTASNPGLEPTETGQFLVVRSDDDGLSWSAPANLTRQLKRPEWRLLLQGPGRGITLTDGTLVFPAQFRDASGLAHSTIVFSDDHGITWHIGTGAKGNTTEAQCAQLTDGSIMLNMRDNRNSTVKDATNGRAVAVTRDLGQTWTVHPSSNSALQEPVCMASIISADISISGNKKKVLFFSNPNNKTTRSNMTIKASLDEGVTWPEKYQIEVNQGEGYGYSCLTMVDDNTVGILYEGVKELYFQKVPVRDILKGLFD